MAYFGQTNIQRLEQSRTIEEEISSVDGALSRTKVRGICGTMMFEGDAALKKINVLSGGEKSRVLLGKILVTPANILLLDEPTNHLDMESVESLADALEEFDGGLVLVTHDEMLLRHLCTRLIVFQGEKPFVFEGTYDHFLSKIGWEEEDDSKASKSITSKKGIDSNRHSSETISLKEQKRRDKKIAQIEAIIVSLEAQQKKLEQKLDRDVEEQNLAEIEKTSYALSEVLEQINQKFTELEDADRAE